MWRQWSLVLWCIQSFSNSSCPGQCTFLKLNTWNKQKTSITQARGFAACGVLTPRGPSKRSESVVLISVYHHVNHSQQIIKKLVSCLLHFREWFYNTNNYKKTIFIGFCFNHLSWKLIHCFQTSRMKPYMWARWDICFREITHGFAANLNTQKTLRMK